MVSNEELLDVLKAQIDATTTAGLAAPQNAASFVDLAVEQTQVMQRVQIVTDIRTTYNLDSLSLGEPVTVAATEGAAPNPADVTAVARARKTLTPREVIAAFDVTFSFLRKNIVRGDVNEALNRVFAKRFGKDIILAAFYGDTTLAGASRTDKTRKILDGFVRQAELDPAVNDVAIDATPVYSTEVFPAMISALPKDYRDQRDELAFYLSAGVYDKYAAEIGGRATALGDMLLAGPWGANLSFMGITLVPVFGMPDGRVLLTLRQNLVIGFGQEMTVGRDLNHRERIMKVTLTADVDARYAEGSAVVLASAA